MRIQIVKVYGKHNKFHLCSIYRNPDLDGNILYCFLMTMATIQENDLKAPFVFIGDFNVHHREWLNSVSPANGHGLRALDFSSESGCEEIIYKPTHRSAKCIDLVILIHLVLLLLLLALL